MEAGFISAAAASLLCAWPRVPVAGVLSAVGQSAGGAHGARSSLLHARFALWDLVGSSPAVHRQVCMIVCTVCEVVCMQVLEFKQLFGGGCCVAGGMWL